LEVFVWDAAAAGYQTSSSSVVLPGLDLGLLEECARMEYASDAVREFQRRCGGSSGEDA
jgi:hypothetical protein